MFQEFTVDGLSCNHCKQRVTDALKKVDGVFNVVVNLSSGRVTVECGDDVGVDVLATAVAEAGYTFQGENEE